jgi:hypothetical protein
MKRTSLPLLRRDFITLLGGAAVRCGHSEQLAPNDWSIVSPSDR